MSSVPVAALIEEGFVLETIHANGIHHRVATVKAHHPSSVIRRTSISGDNDNDNDKQHQRIDKCQPSPPFVIFLHGWPDGWSSWRQQLLELAEAGYPVCAPDMRGHGGTEAPTNFRDYRVDIICNDVVGIARHYCGKEKLRLVVVGHDWGAYSAWHTALLHPNVVVGVVGMSIPYLGPLSPSNVPFLAKLQDQFGVCLPQLPYAATRGEQHQARFHYILHHNLPHAAEEYDAHREEALYRIYGDCPSVACDPPNVRNSLMFPSDHRHHPHPARNHEREEEAAHTPPAAATTAEQPLDARSAPGLWARLPRPKALPTWLSQEEFNYRVQQVRQSGFRGGLAWYRVVDANWWFLHRKFAPTLHRARFDNDKDNNSGHLGRLTQPALFLVGGQDRSVLRTHGGLKRVLEGAKRNARDIRVVVYPNTAHWIQQEQAPRVTADLLHFLSSLVVPIPSSSHHLGASKL